MGLKIKKFLEDNGISQIFLSRKTGIPPVKLNLALNGNRRLTFEEYCLICGALDVNTDKFIQPRKMVLKAPADRPEKEVV